MRPAISRRDVLKNGAAACAGIALNGCAAPKRGHADRTGAGHADAILHNARIATQDGRRPAASALAIRDGHFVAVGSEPSVMSFRGPQTRVIDARGRAVIPGLNDSHIHVIRGGLNYNMELRWDGVPSLSDALAMLRNQATRTIPPQWVRVVGGW